MRPVIVVPVVLTVIYARDTCEAADSRSLVAMRSLSLKC